MVPAFHFFFTRLCGTILDPIDRLSPFLGILLLSAATSLAVLLGYSLISSPEKIKGAKNRIKAHILAIRLYRDFWKVIVSSFFKSLFHTLRYFALNLLPLLLLFPVLFLIFVQMDIRYGMRPFFPGERFAVKAKWDGGINPAAVELETDPLYRQVMNPVFLRALDEVNWKLEARQVGGGAVTIRVPGEPSVSKSLVVGTRVVALSNRRLRAPSWLFFLYPAERPLPAASRLRSVAIEYPSRRIRFLGISAHWLAYYLVLTFLMVLGLKKRFGVEF